MAQKFHTMKLNVCGRRENGHPISLLSMTTATARKETASLA